MYSTHVYAYYDIKVSAIIQYNALELCVLRHTREQNHYLVGH